MAALLQHFTLTQDHVTLLRNAYVSWHYMEWGAPCIDGKRPYGNGDVARDVARLLGWELFEDADGEKHFTADQRDRACDLHKETETALQVVLASGSFEPGEYVADKYDCNWRLLPEGGGS